jgi:hypothetical protein
LPRNAIFVLVLTVKPALRRFYTASVDFCLWQLAAMGNSLPIMMTSLMVKWSAIPQHPNFSSFAPAPVEITRDLLTEYQGVLGESAGCRTF